MHAAPHGSPPTDHLGAGYPSRHGNHFARPVSSANRNCMNSHYPN